MKESAPQMIQYISDEIVLEYKYSSLDCHRAIEAMTQWMINPNPQIKEKTTKKTVRWLRELSYTVIWLS